MLKNYYTFQLLFSILESSLVAGFPVSAKGTRSTNNNDGLSAMVNMGSLGLNIMTGRMYNPLDPNSFMTGGISQFVAGDGRYIPNYDPNKYSFIYAGKSNMNFGNGGCCGSDGTNNRQGIYGNTIVSNNNQEIHTTKSVPQSVTMSSDRSGFGITADKIKNYGLDTPQQSQLNTWKGEWADNVSNDHKNSKVPNSSKSTSWNGNWNKNWPGNKEQGVAEQNTQHKSEKFPSWSGDWSKHFTGNKADAGNGNTDNGQPNKLPSWAGDWSKIFPAESTPEKSSNGGESSTSKSIADWSGKWNKNWPGINESYGDIFDKVNTTPKLTVSSENVPIPNGKGKGTFQRTEKVLQEILNAVQKFDISE